MLYSSFPPASCFTYGSGDVSVLLSQFVPPSPSPAEFTSPSSTSVYLLLPFKYSAVPFYKIPCVCINVLCFPLSDLLHSVSQFLGSSTSVKLTRICSFSWLSNISLCICSTTSLSIVLLIDIRLLPCPGYFKECCNGHWGMYVFLDVWFSQVYGQ